MTRRVASVDLGSNTVRLLVAEQTEEGDLRSLHEERRIIRLGEGLHTAGRLLDHRMQRAIETLREFREICRRYGDVSLQVVATSAVREAANREAFVDRVRREVGLEMQVISWEEEARLTLEGVLWKLPLENRRYLVFDIGGGSTEYILGEGRELKGSAGTRLGVVRLTERFLTRHPVDPKELEALRAFIAGELQTVRRQLKDPVPQDLVGTAGTVTTLAALEKNLYPYDPLQIHGTRLSRERVAFWLDYLGGLTLEERLRLKPLEKGREDLIIAGTALTLETLRIFDAPGLLVSEYALREGLLLRALGQKSQARCEGRGKGLTSPGN